MIGSDRLPWMADAACLSSPLGPEDFHPHRGTSVAALRRVCLDCPVMAECRDYAVREERLGFWGGLSERERRRERRRRGITLTHDHNIDVDVDEGGLGVVV